MNEQVHDPDFNPYVARGFAFEWSAEFYAWRARKRGFTTEVYRVSNVIECGGPWFVNLKEGNPNVR